MPLSQRLQELWITIMSFLRFLARIPVALLIVVAAATGCLLLLLFVYRAAEWIFTHALARPW